MKTDSYELETRIESLLKDDQYLDHPLREALSELWELNHQQWQRVEKITQLSDSYQSMMMRRERSLSERFNKQLRQLEKITRISDMYQKNLHEMNLELEKTSLEDPLTGLPNRRMIMRHLEGEFDRALLNSQQLGVAMVDVDYFKNVNDDYGHQVGDEVLISLSQIISSHVGEYGFCGRWGGEEFLILILDSNKDQVIQYMSELREKIALSKIDLSPTIMIQLSVSIGLSFFMEGDSSDVLLGRADKGLYQAKKEGRNNIVFN